MIFNGIEKSQNYLFLNSLKSASSFGALGYRFGREAALVILDNHFVAVDSPLRWAADGLAGQDVLLEFGQQGGNIADTKNSLEFLLQALFLDAAELSNISGRDIALASGGVFQLIGDIHQVTGDRALARTSQIGDLVASLRAAQTTETATVDGRSQDDDFLGVSQNADHMRKRRVDFDEVIGGFLDDGQNLVFSVLDSVRFAADGDFHTVDVDLLLSREDFNFFFVQQDGDDLLRE